MTKISTILFDADGTLWVGENHVIGAAEALDKLRSRGIKTFIITNNSNNTRYEICKKLLKRGFNGIQPENIISAGYVSAQYLISNGFDEKSKVFVVGEPGLAKELRNNGLTVVTVDDYDSKIDIPEITIDSTIRAVVAGVDTTLSYRKLAIASRIIIENDALFIGTNCDACDPVGSGILVPDAMPTIRFIECSTGRNAIILGKPTTSMFEPLKNLLNINENEVMMVGDRLNTDIKFAKNIGVVATLVLTGIATKDDALCAVPSEKPDYIVDSVANLPQLIDEISCCNKKDNKENDHGKTLDFILLSTERQKEVRA